MFWYGLYCVCVWVNGHPSEDLLPLSTRVGVGAGANLKTVQSVSTAKTLLLIRKKTAAEFLVIKNLQSDAKGTVTSGGKRPEESGTTSSGEKQHFQ